MSEDKVESNIKSIDFEPRTPQENDQNYKKHMMLILQKVEK